MKMPPTQGALDAVESALAAIGDEISEHVSGRGTVGSLQQRTAFHANLEAITITRISDQAASAAACSLA
ncbi:hypothetical protein [Streptomyces roseochromogenus]|uniref:Uncharacterized protein n=1 Tax=Streptomyces roseochromogenus subsp. oscitans DS 12.976 TaxID=1352936 RepID=V6JPU4_STRRC|nr:hypothetical protein [Streptomyces roseochromogenus]EST18869.1 hypothetical protein M878_43935 [Streptomyces roseochromogenus subsp. oscitans DS 12.976]